MELKSKAKHIDNTFFKSHYKIILCKSEKDFYIELKKHKVPFKLYSEWLPEDAGAYTHGINLPSVNKKTQKRFIIICIKPKEKEWERFLIHEAVHIFRSEMTLIEEKNPSEEFECYSVEEIAINLIDAYRDKK
jgi:hypothetical protein